MTQFKVINYRETPKSLESGLLQPGPRSGDLAASPILLLCPNCAAQSIYALPQTSGTTTFPH
jgi:hypothetical protein